MATKYYPQLIHGNLTELTQKDADESFQGWLNKPLYLTSPATHFGFVYQGNPTLYRNQGEQEYKLYPGMYFSLPGEGWVGGKDSSGIVITIPKFSGTFSIGGPIEEQGRFAYINGGTDSLLIPPLMVGAPCLNALYFPTKVDQTWHTHPSYRLGMVVSGQGKCETPEGTINLVPGLIIGIPAEEKHKFRTTSENLILVVFHPDSDVGFTHQNHPMLNRTIVSGLSASQLPIIQTKGLIANS
jgi:mannose-6-phosphate isomerase-like protein (cupin superfamily)